MGLSVFREPICVLLARKSGRPVKLAYSRQEEFVDRPTRACLGPYTIRMGVKNDGSITAIDRHIVSTAGAHIECAALSSLIAEAAANPLYRRATYRAEVDAIYTNKTPCGAMRGFGNPEETFVREQVMDMAAEALGMDPVDFRLRNLCQLGDPGTFGPDFPITSSGMADCLRIGAERIGWKTRRGGAAPQAPAGPAELRAPPQPFRPPRPARRRPTPSRPRGLLHGPQQRGLAGARRAQQRPHQVPRGRLRGADRLARIGRHQRLHLSRPDRRRGTGDTVRDRLGGVGRHRHQPLRDRLARLPHHVHPGPGRGTGRGRCPAEAARPRVQDSGRARGDSGRPRRDGVRRWASLPSP